jgi:hypothetical protein
MAFLRKKKKVANLNTPDNKPTQITIVIDDLRTLLGVENLYILADSVLYEDSSDDSSIIDGELEEKQPQQQQPTKKRRTSVRRNRNAFIEGSHEYQLRSNRDDDYSDLEDFIVCSKGADYNQREEDLALAQE